MLREEVSVCKHRVDYGKEQMPEAEINASAGMTPSPAGEQKCWERQDN